MYDILIYRYFLPKISEPLSQSQPNLTQSFLGEKGFPVCSYEVTVPFLFKGEIIRTTGQISIKLGTKHVSEKDFQVYSNAGPVHFKGEMI